MTHVRLLAMKCLFSLVILYIILGVGFDVSFGNVFLITLVLGALSYALGDLMLLSRSNNTVATVADFVLAFAVIYFMTDALTAGNDVFEATLYSAIPLTIFEYFFHKSVTRSIDGEKEEQHQKSVQPSNELSMEASEELSPDESENKNK